MARPEKSTRIIQLLSETLGQETSVMTMQRFRRFFPFVLDQRTACRSIASFTLLVLIVMGLSALSDAQQTCQPDGDVDQSGSVTAADALLVLQQALNLNQLNTCQLNIADVFPQPTAPDGIITASDALCIFQKALGLPSCLDINPLVSSGGDHTCGILDTGAMACWGLDDEGQSAPPAGTFTTVSAGADHTCGILDTGAVACWGLDDEGQSMPPAGTFTMVSAGVDHTCGILDTGAVACWGLDDEGQSTPPAGTFTMVSTGGDHTCGILDTGAVACWGLDDDGQSAPPAGTFTMVSAGADHTCGILDTGAVACWGLDDDGQSTPPAGTFTEVSAGADHTCGILDTGAVACWGLDDDGQSTPPAGRFTAVSAGADHTCGILDTGAVVCWGLDDDGQSAPSGRATTPNLEVGTPTVDDTAPETGATITLSVTVSNTGNAESATTTLRYYRSTDATITTSDTAMGTDAVGALSASGTSAQSIPLTAPATAGAYYYGACVDAVTDESDTTDNCSASVKVDVEEPARPDLEVGTPTADDTTPGTGASFTLSATVSNTGNGESPATTLRYYRSTDATITASDTAVGTDAVGVLSASETSAQSISLTALATAGTYYYGACVEAVTDESDTADNCSPPVKVDVGAPARPDLEVGTPTVNDTTPETGATFTLSAMVTNAGDAESAATTLRYYRSTDATVTTSDTAVGTDTVGALSASGTSAQAISLTAPATAGTYYFGACVDAVTDESDTADNCSPPVKVDVEAPKYPDLEVGTPTVDDTTPETGATFTLSATVTNTGDAESAATTLRYYRSTDATVTMSDTAVGTDAVGALSASGTSAQSISLTAPATAGTYYYGACVDTVTVESDTTNNCSSSAPVIVEEEQQQQQGNPDLEVGSPSVSDNSLSAGTSFTLSATVSNAGDGESAATTLRYYRSTDATITISDTEVGTDAVGVLSASGTSDESIELTAPSTAGAYYYGACVEAVTDESDTTNNCSASVTVTVAEPQPDLVVNSFTITLGPTLETSAGALVILNQRVANVGDAASAATTVRYYRSTDATITASDTQVSTDAVPELTASSRFVERHNEILPTAPGTYYYGACVDTVTGESDTTNNCSSSAKVTVPESQPDLVVGSASVDDSNLNTGDSFTLSATVSNAGDEQSATTTLRYYRSTDSTISSSDTQVGMDAVGALAASGTSAGSISLTAPSTPGTYYYGACVDAVTDESDTTNNCSSSVTIAVEEESSGQPDLRIVGVSAGTPLDGVFPETLIQFSASVRNYGDANSDATTLRYYRSTDATISVSDTEVGTDDVSALVPSAQVSEGIDLHAPSTAGTYYYGACVDAVTDESDTTNNCSTSVQVTVPQPQEQQHDNPDLVVRSPSVGFSSQHPEATFTLSATVQNDGDGASPATTLRYYRSTDVAITTSDTEVDTDSVAALAASGSTVGSVDVIAPTPPGRYYYGACVDAVSGESDTTNNCSTSVHITVTQPSDLVVGSPSVGDSSQAPGATFTLSTTVENKGGGGSLATTLRYYRSTDTAISTSDIEVDTAGVGALAASHTRSQSVDLTAPTAPGTYYYGACVDAVAGEADTTNNCSTSVPIAVTQPSDLVVGSPTVDKTNLTALARFTLSATVQNEGDGDSPTTTLRYFRSTDATISTADTEEDSDAVGALAASESSSESVGLRAPTTPGTYYYGACVDAVAGESDTANNCSASVQVTAVALPDDCTNNTSTTCQIRVAGFTSGAIENSGDRDWIRITGLPLHGLLVSGHRYLFVVAGRGTIAHGVWIDALDSPVFEVLDSTGASLSPRVAYESTSGTPEVEFVAGATQVYYVAVSASESSATGGYTVRTVNTTSSTVQALQFRSDPGADDTYSVNDEITVRVIFSSGVNVTGTPRLALDIGGLKRQASYTGGTATTADLTFSYTVAEGDSDTDGIAISANSLTTPSGSSIRADGMDVPLQHAAVPVDSGHKVDVEEPTQPDLKAGAPTVDEATPETGATFTLSATVTNAGDAESPATTLRYYRSTDATISSADTQVGTDAVGALSASGTSDESIELTAPSTAGAYYYGACVEAVTDESDTTNNCSASVTVTVAEPQPDLVVDSFTITLGPTLETSPGALVKLNQRVANVGDAASAATTVRYYRSTDATITTSDTQVSTDAVPELAASSRSVEAQNERLPTAPGTYYYGACVDTVAGESDTANNCSRSVKVTVPEPQPDLVVGSASVDDSNLNTGDSFTLSATVSNAGDERSAASTLRYYRSTDSTISSSDTEVGTDAVGALAASGTSAESISLTAPATAGAYYYGACVDAVTDESDTTNNCSASVTIAVEEESSGQPDLRIVGVSAGTPLDGVGPGTRIQFGANVRNYGDANSDATTLRYYRSTDATITTSDTEVGTDEVSALVPSAQVSEGIDLYAPSMAGTYYYGACVDAVTGESDTTNNCSGALKIDVN